MFSLICRAVLVVLASVRLERGGGPSQVLDKRVLRWPRRLAQQPPAGSAIYFIGREGPVYNTTLVRASVSLQR